MFKLCILEFGGKLVVIIFEDVDLVVVILMMVFFGVMNVG